MLDTGARPVGWKIGRGIVKGEEHLEPVIGYLTSATQLAPRAVFASRGFSALRVDAEAALELGDDGTVPRVGAALELVDVSRPPDDFETIVAENIWHRGVAFGPLREEPRPGEVEARVLINGTVRAAMAARVDFPETARTVRRLFGAVGETVETGDLVIAGSLLHVPVAAGDEVVVDLGELGQVGVTIS